ncbi:hypothetical protein DV736_g642, partial [Chaetothyriales sp. CBS 134916]
MEVPHTRSCFYIGGHYQDLIVNGRNTGQIHVGQIYVEKLVPTDVNQTSPLIFWTGSFQTGMNWLNTPDGRIGWASYFMSKGYTVYLTDQSQRGRSPWNPYTSDSFAIPTTTYCEKFWTATKSSADIWPQAALHTEFPGTGKQGDPTFDAFYASQVPAFTDRRLTEMLAKEALTALLDNVGSAYLITHSQGGPHGFVAADSRPDLIKGLVSLEPEGPPFINEVVRVTGEVTRPYGITVTPIAYDPPLAQASELDTTIVSPAGPGKCKCVLQGTNARKLCNLSKVPMLLVTTEASYHAVYDHCTVQYLQQGGVDVEWLDLPKAGIGGNGHLMFMEKNNLDIASRIEQWIAGKNS